MALEQNSPDYLISLANLEVNSILKTLEQPDMYVNGNAMLSLLTSGTPLTNGSKKVHPQKRKMTTLQDLGLSIYLHQRARHRNQTKLHTLKVWHYRKHKLPQDGQFIIQLL